MTPRLTAIEIKNPDYVESLHTSVGAVDLLLKNPEEDRAGSIEIRIDSKQLYSLEYFAERGARAEDGKFPAIVYVLYFGEEVTVFIGLYEVFSLGKGGVVRNKFNLFRSNLDDAGFFQSPRLVSIEGAILLKYEGGVASFDSLGNVNWHIGCNYDDELTRVDDSYLWFSNEHINEGREWKVNLIDGKAC